MIFKDDKFYGCQVERRGDKVLTRPTHSAHVTGVYQVAKLDKVFNLIFYMQISQKTEVQYICIKCCLLKERKPKSLPVTPVLKEAINYEMIGAH